MSLWSPPEGTSEELEQIRKLLMDRNLFELLNDLEAKAKAATLPKITACPKCDSTSPPDWTERSPGGNSQCSDCKKPSANWAWVKQSPSPFHPGPDTVLALITALREAAELAQDLATRRVLCDDGKATMYLHHVPTVSFFKNESIDIGQKARDWLAKFRCAQSPTDKTKGEKG